MHIHAAVNHWQGVSKTLHSSDERPGEK